MLSPLTSTTSNGIRNKWLRDRCRDFLAGPRDDPAFCARGTGSFGGVKQLGSGVNHQPQSSAEVTDRAELYVCPLLCLHGTLQGEIYLRLLKRKVRLRAVFLASLPHILSAHSWFWHNLQVFKRIWHLQWSTAFVAQSLCTTEWHTGTYLIGLPAGN